MKTILLVLLSIASGLTYAQKEPVRKASNMYGAVQPQYENWIDTSNMYNSRYGSVARLTQDNMPCIIPNTAITTMPNAFEKKKQPDTIPNFWKYRNRLGKPAPVLQNLYYPNEFKVPDVWNKDSLKR